jgi:hypothetical protein
MEQEAYHCSITANITPKEAMKRISRVSDWWAKNTEGSTQKVNDVFTVRFGETFVSFKITEIIWDTEMVWRVTDCYLHWQKDKTEWNGTKIVWDLSEKDHSTSIHFTHLGLVPGVECYENCVEGWDGHIKGSLLKLLTENKGNPE